MLITNHIPAFDSRTYGFKKLLLLIQSDENEFEVQEGTGIHYVRSVSRKWGWKEHLYMTITVLPSVKSKIFQLEKPTVLSQPLYLFLVIPHVCAYKVPICAGMPPYLQVAQFMNYDVIYYVFWRAEKSGVYGDCTI